VIVISTHYENQNLSNRLGEVLISVFDSNVVDRWFEWNQGL